MLKWAKWRAKTPTPPTIVQIRRRENFPFQLEAPPIEWLAYRYKARLLVLIGLESLVKRRLPRQAASPRRDTAQKRRPAAAPPRQGVPPPRLGTAKQPKPVKATRIAETTKVQSLQQTELPQGEKGAVKSKPSTQQVSGDTKRVIAQRAVGVEASQKQALNEWKPTPQNVTEVDRTPKLEARPSVKDEQPLLETRDVARERISSEEARPPPGELTEPQKRSANILGFLASDLITSGATRSQPFELNKENIRHREIDSFSVLLSQTMDTIGDKQTTETPKNEPNPASSSVGVDKEPEDFIPQNDSLLEWFPIMTPEDRDVVLLEYGDAIKANKQIKIGRRLAREIKTPKEFSVEGLLSASYKLPQQGRRNHNLLNAAGDILTLKPHIFMRDRGEAEAFALEEYAFRGRLPLRFTYWTDASCPHFEPGQHAPTGLSVVERTRDSRGKWTWILTAYRSSESLTSQKAELCAIIQALKLALSKIDMLTRLGKSRVGDKAVVLFTDSLDTLEKLEDLKHWHLKTPSEYWRLQAKVLELVASLRWLGAHVELHWVPAHTGRIPGNEIADRLACTSAWVSVPKKVVAEQSAQRNSS